MKDLSLARLCSKNGVGVGVYEVELLENGQLKFTVIEDEWRSGSVALRAE